MIFKYFRTNYLELINMENTEETGKETEETVELESKIEENSQTSSMVAKVNGLNIGHRISKIHL